MAQDADVPTTAHSINQLFEAVAHEKNIRDDELFRQYYEKVAHESLSRFLKDVTSCPPEILAYCQSLLAPKPEPPPQV